MVFGLRHEGGNFYEAAMAGHKATAFTKSNIPIFLKFYLAPFKAGKMTSILISGEAGSVQDFKTAVSRVADLWPFLNRDYVTGSATKVDRWKACNEAYPHVLHLLEVHMELSAQGVEGLANSEFIELLLEATQ